MNSVIDPGIEARAGELFRDHRRRICERTDRWFALLMLVQWVAGIVIALVVSPRTWAGSTSQTHFHVWSAILLGGAIGSIPIYLARRHPGAALTRHTIACGQMLWSALLIHLTGGRIETHFHVFGSLAFLSFYRDWRVFIPATLIVGMDHLIRGIYWPQSVYGVLMATPWRSVEHAVWVVFENIFLVRACRQSVAEMSDIARQRARLESVKDLVEKEVERRTEELRIWKHALTEHAIISEADADGRITYASDSFCRISGYSREELLGNDHRILSSGYHPGEFWTEMYAALARHGVWRGEVCNRSKNGSLHWVHTTNVASKAADGRISGYVSMRIDITQQKRNEQELLDARQQADAANRAKSEFLANMSHEIRTPMNGIIGMTELALDSELTVQQHEYLNTVRECAYALLNLLNDILDLSKIEAGKLELETTNFNLVTTLESALDVLSHRATEKGLELICSIDPATPRNVYGDPLRLMQVLINLLGNAIKFTERGEIVVGTQVEGTTEKGVTLRFFVSDTGIGIPTERIPAIFKSFTQADGATTRKYGGTGLGLTISRQIVELMGGRLGVESEPGKGSTFSFRVTLPCVDQSPKTDPDRPGEADALSTIADKRILVVDDNATNRRVLQLMLESWGFRVVIATGGNEGLHVLRDGQNAGRPFDVLLLDVQMPDMDGLDVARTVVHHADFGRPKIVFLSSIGGQRDIDPENSTLCDACLTKPVKQSLLMDTLLELLEIRSGGDQRPQGNEATRQRNNEATRQQGKKATRQRGNEATKQQSDEATIPPSGQAPQRRENRSKPRVRETAFVTGLSPDARSGAVRVLIVEDNAVNRRVASGILQKFGCMVTEADTGKAALRILEAIQFDLVFMDLQMPAMDGLETTAILRADERWKNLPIIAMTAHAMKGDRDKCLEAGMSDYVAKPIRIDEIRNVIEKWAPRNRLQATSPHSPAAPEHGAASRSLQSLTSDGSMSEDPGPARPGAEVNSPTGEVAASGQPPHRFGPERPFGGEPLRVEPLTAEGPPVNMAMALTHLAGDDELFREVLASFVEELPQQLEEFQEACANADLQRLGAIAHTLKGSASNVCAEPTRRLARRIEELSTEGGVEAVAALLPELKEEADRVRAFAATLVHQEKQDA